MDGLAFDTYAAANEWLNETGHYGSIQPINKNGMWGKFRIVRYDNGGVWAFASPTKLVALTDW